MRTFTFNHQMRGHSDRCEVCGGPLLLGVTRRCIPCRVWPAYRTHRSLREEQDAATYPDLPPLDYPNYPALRSESDQRAIERRAQAARPAPIVGDAGDARSLRAQYEAEVWAWVEGDKPAFPLDSRCAICCLIMTEYAHPLYVITASEPGYRCPAHSAPPAELVDWRVA